MKNPNKYVIALTVALGMFLAVLDATIVSVALIPISRAMHTTFNDIQWIFVGYLLANAAIEVMSGYLGNRMGNKRLYLAGLTVFTLASVLCGLAPNEGWLIGFRIIQGFGGGVILPLGIAMSLERFSKAERAKVTAVVGVPLLLAPVVGPIIGGWIIDNLNWQSIFFVNLPLGIAAIALSWWILPTDKSAAQGQKSARFDYLGLILPTVGVVTLVYAFKVVSQTDPTTVTPANPQGDLHGWGYWQVWALMAVGASLLGAFTLLALRKSDAVLDLRLFKNYDFAISNLINWLSTVVNFGILALVPQFLQSIHSPNLSAIDTGLTLVPMGLATLIGIVLAASLYSKIGARVLVMTGAGLFALGFWQLSQLTPTVQTSDLWLWLFLLGLGITLTAMPVKTLALEALSGEALNKASSLVNSTQLIFSSIGSAILVTVLVQQTTTHARELLVALPIGAISDPLTLRGIAAQAGTNALNEVFGLLMYGALGLVVIALALPGRKKPISQPIEPETTTAKQEARPVAV